MKICLSLLLAAAASAASAQSTPPPDSIDPLTGGMQVGARCDGSTDWCHMNAPVGEQVLALFALNGFDGWASTTRGAVVHWYGGNWSFVETGTFADLDALWGAATDDVWAGGKAGTLLHWDGASWTPIDAGTTADIVSISGVASDDLWVLASDGTALHWDGGSFTATATGGTPVAIFALGPADVMAAGNGGCERWNGSAWATTPCGLGSETAAAIWGSGSNDVWVVGSLLDRGDETTTRSHWNGSAWTVEQFFQCDACGANASWPGRFLTIAGSSANDVWINAQWHWDGSAWSKARDTASTVTAEGSDALVYSLRNGSLFVADAYTATVIPQDRFWSIRGAAGDSWFLSLYGWIYSWDGVSFTLRSGGGQSLGGANFGLSSSNVWSSTNGAMMHWNGSSWTSSPIAAGAIANLGWLRSGSDGIAFGTLADGTRASWHWDGARWTQNTFTFGGDTFWDVAGSSGSNFWAVGEHDANGSSTDAAWRWNGSAWTRYVPGAGSAIVGVFSSAPSAAWLLEAQPATTTRSVLRWNGSGFTSMGSFDVDEVAATSPTDVWIAQQFLGGLTWHWGGVQWRQVLVPWRVGVQKLWANSSEVLAVTQTGGVYRRAAP